jgi:hypothetical protein
MDKKNRPIKDLDEDGETTIHGGRRRGRGRYIHTTLGGARRIEIDMG